MIPASNFELMAVKSGTDLAIRAGGFGADVVGHNPLLPAKLSALSDRSTRGPTMSDAIALRPRAAG
jgi:hypothetical protein